MIKLSFHLNIKTHSEWYCANVGSGTYSKIYPWKYIIRRNVNSDFSIVTVCRVAIIFFKLRVLKNFMQKF